MGKIYILLPMIGYLIAMFAVALFCSRIKTNKGGEGFIQEYFIGGRTMGGFVLAMTLIATYASASSFIGGPGVAYKLGFGWVLLAMIQVPTAFLTLGVLGKKLAIVSRKIKAVTITGFLKARYESNTVVILSSVAILVFFAATMVAQFIGGARLFQSVTGYSYRTGLIIFGLSVVLYTTIGGFKAVAITDAIQGIVMMIATVFLFYSVVKFGGGIDNIMQKIQEVSPSMLTPDAGGAISRPYILSFWILVGFAVLGLPQTSIRCMGFKDSKSLHNAMIIGTIVVGFLMLGMHIIGVFGSVVVPGIEIGDMAIPEITLKVMNPVLAGIFIAGPLAAIMSTVDSMLILASATIIKDLYINLFGGREEGKIVSKMSFIITGVVGFLVFLLSLDPKSSLVWINLFAFGGLEAVFLWPTILGLYWKRANALGALISMISGVGAYVIFTLYFPKPFGMHQIVPTILISLLGFIIGSYVGKKPGKEVEELFFY